MTTVIAVYDGDGTCLGRCDARCHEAKGPVCSCVCGGKNHGVGHEQAQQNVTEWAEKEFGEALATYKQSRELVQDLTIRSTDYQMPLPGFAP